MDRAVQELDEMMLPSIALRRQFRDKPEQFLDTQNVSRYALTLPQPLSLKQGGVTANQFSIYEQFGRNRPLAGSRVDVNSNDNPITSSQYVGTPGSISAQLQQQIIQPGDVQTQQQQQLL
ncbi:unnamed protein product [[Candida] boidinii]|nr:unnamed protein product [[Candida] boidinii]